MSDETENKGTHGFPGVWGLIANGSMLTLFAFVFWQQQHSTVGQLRELQQLMWQSSREDRELMRVEMRTAHELSAKRWHQIEELTAAVRSLTAVGKSVEKKLEKDK